MNAHYPSLFAKAMGSAHSPYNYQCRLACGDDAGITDLSILARGTDCRSLLIQVPTGLGKTAAVVMAWLWNRVHLNNSQWPRRLVYCLPMRTLVEQTRDNVAIWLNNLDLPREKVNLHLLMGSEDPSPFDLYPERLSILVGTQDMLLSRALNRGYGLSRFRWPMHFALLNNDALWVMDETQLMGVGVETSAQLDSFRSRLLTEGNCATWWMSATPSPAQLDTVDHPEPAGGWEILTLSETEKQAPEVIQRIASRKPVAKAAFALSSATKSPKYEKELVNLILARHKPDTLTLVIVNRVKRAQDIYKELCKQKKIATEDIALIHSRFRPGDRQKHEKLLAKDRKGNRIIIATQAIEAGVDISARLLITELAPWSSLVQRVGRCNRYGEWNKTDLQAEIIWIDLQPKDEKDDLCLPYDFDSLKQARAEITNLTAASPQQLAAIQVKPKSIIRPILRRKDLLDLFDTTADLCGHDIDISRYIRDGDDTDVQVFWRDFPDDKLQEQKSPDRNELCRVGAHIFREFCKKNKPWIWNHLEDQWEPAQHIVAGNIYLLKVGSGGYSDQEGWTKEPKDQPTPLPSNRSKEEATAGDPKAFGQTEWQTIAQHTSAVKKELERLLAEIPLNQDLPATLRSAALWHDMGKAHPIFQSTFPDHPLWAKSPLDERGHSRHREGEKGPVKFFRHELASALAWLAATPPDHPERDLIAYIIAAHHGKVRLSIRSLPEESPTPRDPEQLYARGVWDGDPLPAVPLGELITPPLTLDLSLMQMGDGKSGPSWLARMIALRDRLGPFRLAYYETLLRVADMQASARA